MAEDELEGIKALLRRGGVQAMPEVVEIRPEIRSAGSWHLVDPEFKPAEPPASPPRRGPKVARSNSHNRNKRHSRSRA
ncbi:hypothetical protein ACFQU2_25665 [Siccirubricoccus deserti]